MNPSSRSATEFGPNVAKAFGRSLAVLGLAAIVTMGAPLAGVSAFGTQAQAETRTLDLYFTHTRERAKITFKKNGKYIKSGLKKINHFLRDWRSNQPTRMDPRLLDTVWAIYQETGSKKPIHVISGYRSPKTNNMLRRRGRRVARRSQHMRGKALDFFLPDVPVAKLRATAIKHHAGGVGFYRGSFVHVDTGRVRHWPRMSRKTLARIFPKGRTIHIPSNGRPLKGYKVAAANLKNGLRYDGSRPRYGVTTNNSLLGKLLKRKDKGTPADAKATAIARARDRAQGAIKVAEARPTTRPAAARPSSGDPFLADARAVVRDGLVVPNSVLPPNARRGEPARPAQPVAVARATVPALRPRADISGGARLESFSAAEALARARGNRTDNVTTATAYARPDATAPGAAAVEALAQGRTPVGGGLPTDLGPARGAAAKTRLALAPAADGTVGARSIAELNRRIRSAFPKREVSGLPSVVERLNGVQPKAAPTPTHMGPIHTAALGNDVLPVATPRAPRIDELTQRAKRSLPKPATIPAHVARRAASRGEVVFVRTANWAPRVRFSIANLYSRDVRQWAVAPTIRRGRFAKMRAPAYRSAASLHAPETVLVSGFANRYRQRTDAFTGAAVSKVTYEALANLY